MRVDLHGSADENVKYERIGFKRPGDGAKILFFADAAMPTYYDGYLVKITTRTTGGWLSFFGIDLDNPNRTFGPDPDHSETPFRVNLDDFMHAWRFLPSTDRANNSDDVDSAILFLSDNYIKLGNNKALSAAKGGGPKYPPGASALFQLAKKLNSFGAQIRGEVDKKDFRDQFGDFLQSWGFE